MFYEEIYLYRELNSLHLVFLTSLSFLRREERYSNQIWWICQNVYRVGIKNLTFSVLWYNRKFIHFTSTSKVTHFLFSIYSLLCFAEHATILLHSIMYHRVSTRKIPHATFDKPNKVVSTIFFFCYFLCVLYNL